MTYNPEKRTWRGRSHRKGGVTGRDPNRHGKTIRQIREEDAMKTDEDQPEADDRDVHTEHCCSKHGCKYSDDNCPVETGKKVQSFPCEYCEADEDYKEYLSGSSTFFAAYRIENHPDREMTFLGIFSSEEKAQAAIDKHRVTGKSAYFPNGWPEYEYTIRECTLDSEYL